eukprot:9154476-Prorocentrum_lima.AAC.1
MGVYPLQHNDWWMAHPAGYEVTTGMITSSKKENCRWYCPCCGTKFNAGKYLACRLLIIVPPNS